MSRNGYIAITSLKRNGRMRPPTDYVYAIAKAGGRPRVFSPFKPSPDVKIPMGMDLTAAVDPDDVSPLDGAIGLVLPGGGDVDPALYGQEPHPRTHAVSRRRDRFEITLLKEALLRDIPVLAICRGMQLMNVVLGGTLQQHLPDEPNRLEHDRDRPRADHAHGVSIDRASLVAEVFGTTNMPVNSHHHQGLDHIAEPLREVAWAEDGVLEAVESQRHAWVVGVQWHPEVMAPVEQRQLEVFRSFVDATVEFSEGRLSQVASA